MPVADVLAQKAAEIPDQVAIEVDGIGSLRFAEWNDSSRRMARALQERGVAKGDRVALLFTNAAAIPYATSYFSVATAGAIAVPLSTRWAPAELSRVLAHAEPRAILYESRLASTLDETLSHGAPTAPLRIAWGPVASLETARAERLIETTSPEPLPCLLTNEDPADILYTSGTTGSPKGVLSTHGNVEFAARRDTLSMFAGSVLLHAMPMYTFAGTHAMMMMALGNNLTQLVMPEFDRERFLDLIEERKVALTYAVPAMLLLALQSPRLRERDTSSLRLVIFGTAPMPPWAIRELSAVFSGAMLVNLYGLTEGGSAVCSMNPAEALSRTGSVGKPVPPTELRIVSENGEDLEPDQVGEIFLKHPTKPRRYFKDPEATDQTWKDGWLRTGDLGTVDSDGYLYIVDRKKDIVIRGGFNICPGEVDQVLEEHPAVAEAATIGVPHPVLGEDLKSFVALKPGARASAGDLQEFCKKRLADYKVPRQIEFRESLPRSPIGKILKRVLREGGENTP